MTELNKQEIARFSKLLEERRAALIDEIHSALLKSGDENFIELAGRVHDLGDDSVADLLMSLKAGSSERETLELADIESALGRIRNGAYGDCLDCGEPISRERLEAYPTAKRCIACQTRREDTRGGRDATPSL